MNTIIFDFDGTIADTTPILLNGVNELSSKYGYKTIKDFSSLRTKDSIEVIKDDLKIAPEKIKMFLRDLFLFVENNLDKAQLIKGIKEILFKLKKNYKLVIFSSNQDEIIKLFLEKNGIDLFDIVIGNIGLSNKGEIINSYSIENNISKNNIIYITDEIRDITSCRKYDISVLGVSWGINDYNSLKSTNPDYLVESPKQIISILKDHF